MRSNNIYNFFGETQKSFSWVQTSSSNLSLFWFRTSRKRIVVFISITLITLFFLFININSLGIILQSSILKFLLYFLWRSFDWLYFFLIQLQYLLITIIVSSLFTVFNWFLSSNLSLSSWMQKHHAEVTPTYFKNKTKLTNIATKTDFSLLLTSVRESLLIPTFQKDQGNVELFSCTQTGLEKFYELSSYFKTYFSLLLSITQPNLQTNRLPYLGGNSLLLGKQHAFPLSKRNMTQFTLSSLLNHSSTPFTLLTDSRQSWEMADNSFFFAGPRYFTEQLYTYIRMTRWISLNTTMNRSELINNENLLSSLNLVNATLKANKTAFIFNSKEWIDYRNTTYLNPFSLKKLYFPNTSAPILKIRNSVCPTFNLPFNYLGGVFNTTYPTILTTEHVISFTNTPKTIFELKSTACYLNNNNLSNLARVLSYGTGVNFIKTSRCGEILYLPKPTKTSFVKRRLF